MLDSEWIGATLIGTGFTRYQQLEVRYFNFVVTPSSDVNKGFVEEMMSFTAYISIISHLKVNDIKTGYQVTLAIGNELQYYIYVQYL